MSYLDDLGSTDIYPPWPGTPPFIDPRQARRIAPNQPQPNPGVGADLPQLPPPDAAATGVSPQPSAPGTPDPLQAAIQQNQQAQAQLSRAKQNMPPLPKPKWYQRLGAVGVGALAGMENAGGHSRAPIDPTQAEQAILAPGYGRKMAQYKQDVAGAQAGVDEAGANLTAQEKVEQAQEQRARAGLAKSTAAVYDAEGKRSPRGNYITFGKDGIFDASEGTILRQPSTKDPNDFIEISPDKGAALGIQPDQNGKYMIPKEGIGPYLTATAKPTAKPTAEERKDEYSQTIGKAMQAGFISARDLSDPVKMDAGIQKALSAGLLSQQEATAARSFPAGNSTPGTTTQAGVERMGALGNVRMLPVYDANNNTIGYRTINDIRDDNKANPDGSRFSPAGEATKILQKNAIFGGLDYSITRAKSAVSKIDNWGTETRAHLANALRTIDPKSGVDAFIQGEIGASMDPDTRNLVIALRGLAEDMMTLRSAASMGQGSDEMRNAILQTIPNAFTDTSKTAIQQLEFAQGLIQRLALSYPRLGMPGSASPARPGAPAGGGPPTGGQGGVVVWGRDAQGNPVRLP